MATSKYCCKSCEQGLPCTSSTFKTNCQNNYEHLKTVPAIPISPNSGLFINALGHLDIDCEILGTKCAWPVGPTTPHQNYNWTVAPATIQEGDQVTLNVSGLAASSLFTVRIQSSFGETFYWALQANTDGNIQNAKYRLNAGGATYTFTPIYGTGTPNVSSYSVNVLPCGESVDCSCSGAVTIRPYLSSNSVASGQPVTLRLIVTNTNECPISQLNLPPIPLPPEITSVTEVSISNESVPGKSTKTFEYVLYAQNSGQDPINLNIQVPASYGNYRCQGIQYAAGGGSAALEVLPTSGVMCGLIIESFTITPSSGEESEERTITLTVRNIGTENLQNLAMPPIPFNQVGVQTTSGDTSISIPNLANLAPNATHTVTRQCYLESMLGLPVNYTLTIPAGLIYATCSGSLINNLAPASASTVLLDTP